MAQNYTLKQQNWIMRSARRPSNSWRKPTSSVPCVPSSRPRHTAPAAQTALTDAVVQPVLPAATALIVAEAEGAFAGTSAILSIIATNRGYLENLRP